MVINAIAIDEGVDNLGMALVKNREDAVYTLILTILEHFNGRFTNQHETVRTLLNGLRCRTLGEFRWYKDTFMSRVMELPENKYDHWKTKFIDGLPSLFAERVRKTLRGSYGEIPYKDYTYGKLIGICTQEGLNLCNELRLSRQLKMDKLKEISQLGDFCTQFGLPETSTHKKKKHKITQIEKINSAYEKSDDKNKGISENDIEEKPIKIDSQHNMFLGMMQIVTAHRCMNIFDTLNSTKVQEKIKLIFENIAIDICAEHPNAFWNRKKHIITLPYEDNFSEADIPTKSRPCQMNTKLVEFYKKEIDNLLQKGLIKPSKSAWS
uniref:Uncharacterized protein n=1 Tax=Nicotiana tabacum TaxID=4097 RepID=A0A1S4CUA2_TOBAC|nr:PREDICTED: uncharacterized protein LOC107822758 [Nicotiana tabacum]